MISCDACGTVFSGSLPDPPSIVVVVCPACKAGLEVHVFSETITVQMATSRTPRVKHA